MIETRVVAVVAAPISRVWALIGNFGDLSYFSPAETVQIVGDSEPSAIGAIRRITLAGGGVGTEQLVALSNAEHRIEYRYFDDPGLPFSDYVARVQLVALPADRTSIDWSARYRIHGSDPDSVKHFIEFGVIRECIAGVERLLA